MLKGTNRARRARSPLSVRKSTALPSGPHSSLSSIHNVSARSFTSSRLPSTPLIGKGFSRRVATTPYSLSPHSVSSVSRRDFSMKVFNHEIKHIQRKAAVAAPDALDFNYLRAESAKRVLDRLSIVRYPFEHTVLLGTDSSALASEITRRHVNNVFDPYNPLQFSESTLEILSKTKDGNLDELSESERMPTEEEIRDALQHMERYAIKDLKTLTIIDPLPEAIDLTRNEITKYMTPLTSPNDRFAVHSLCSPLAEIPIQPAPPDQQFTGQAAKTPNSSVAIDSQHADNSIVNHMYKDKSQLVISNLTLHWENDLPGAFKRAHDMLEPNGAFIGAMIGGETLRELRSALTLADMERRGGVSHHVSPFTLTKDVGDLLTKAGFEMVSVDVDTINIPYPDMFTLVHHIQKMGEQHAPFNIVNRVSKDTFIAAASIYESLYRDRDGLLNCNVDILMFIGWKYHASMNPKAKRGSATAKIGDIVNAPDAEFESFDSIDLGAQPGGSSNLNLHRVDPHGGPSHH